MSLAILRLVANVIGNNLHLRTYVNNIHSGAKLTPSLSRCYQDEGRIAKMLWYWSRRRQRGRQGKDVTIISAKEDYVIIGSRQSDHYFRSVCLFVCLFVCLCRVFLSRLRSDLDQTRTHVTCPGLVVSPRIWVLCDPWGLGDPQKTCIFRCFGAAVNHHSVAASQLYFYSP